MKTTADPRMGTRLKIFLVETSTHFRQAERHALRNSDVTVVGEVDKLDNATADLKVTAPNVVILDGASVDSDPAVLGERIKDLRRVGCRVIVMADPGFHTDRAAAREHAAAALAAGARGYLLKDRALHRLAPAVEQVAVGRSVLDTRIATLLFRHLTAGRSPEPANPISLLSNREQQVVHAIADGLSNAEIAALLGVSITTIKSHVSAILRILQLRDRLQIAIAAHRFGWTSSACEDGPIVTSSGTRTGA